MLFVTDLGDSFLLGAMLMVAVLLLLAMGCRRGASFLLLACSTAMLAIAFAKLMFLGCQPRLGGMGIISPSGHTAFSTAFYIGLGMLAAARMPQGKARYVPLGALGALAFTIGMSRVSLGFHSLPEVLLGGSFGLSGLLLARRFAPLDNLPRFEWRVMILPLLASVVVLHGVRLPAEDFIRLLAQALGAHVRYCAPVPQP